MNMALIDTHSIIKELIEAGTSEKEAEILVKRFVAKDEVNWLKNELATKHDINELKSDINKNNAEIALLKTISIANFIILVGAVVTLLFKQF
jgi:hypothetical protein